MTRLIVSIISLIATGAANAALSNVSVPDVPNVNFYRITDYNAEKSQRQTISVPYQITADGTGSLAVTLTVTHPGVDFANDCHGSPQGDPNATCMENEDDGRQQVFFDVAYKACGYGDQIMLSREQQRSVTHSFSNPDQYHASSCQQDPTFTSGRLVLIRLPFPRTVPGYNPTSGRYRAQLTLTVGEPS